MIQALIDAKLKQEQEEHGKRLRSGCWSPSSFGMCFRKQYWNRMNEPITNPPDILDLRKMKAGKHFHDYVESFLPSHSVEVKVEHKPDVFGYADIVSDDEVTDIKSVHSKSFWYSQRDGYDVTKEKRPNILQCAAYALFLNKPKFSLYMISKDDMCTEEYHFLTALWAKEVENELRALRSFWDAKTLPPAHPRAFKTKDEFKECRAYCGYKDKCISCGHVIPPEVKKEKKNV